MSCEHLICAQCASPVVEARCPACRAARAQVHHHHASGLTLPLTVAALLALVLVTLILQLMH
jgi:predicted amidophosphoribosyltransferase